MITFLLIGGVLAVLVALLTFAAGWLIAYELPAYLGYWDLSPQHLEKPPLDEEKSGCPDY